MYKTCRIEHIFWKYVLNFNSSSLDRKLHFQHTVLETKVDCRIQSSNYVFKFY